MPARLTLVARARHGLIALAIMAAGACTADAERDNVSATDDSAADSMAVPATPVTTPSARLAFAPDSVLIRRGACPFECCVYREWQARTAIPVLTDARSGVAPAYTLEPGQRFVADNGEVRITQPARVVVRDTVTTNLGEQRRFLPGDTLVLLDYRGEGTWNVWHRGRVLEFVEQFWGMSGTESRAEVLGEHRTEWWVHVQSPRAGWFHADSTVRFSGADACGGQITR